MNDGYTPKYRQQYSRNIRMQFWASQEEYERIQKRQKASNSKNLSEYLRNAAIRGYVLNAYIPGLREVLSLFHRLSSNSNQIAKRLNESGRIYSVDVQELLSGQKEIEERLRQLVETVNRIK